ncbi:hypothetical protein [Clostridium sp.]|uniref:hypothetical protein n=1 Tax=Clostridium sp. TaxID=1506 RepID=UPI003F4BCEC8
MKKFVDFIIPTAVYFITSLFVFVILDQIDTKSDMPIITRLGFSTGLTIGYVIFELINKNNKK